MPSYVTVSGRGLAALRSLPPGKPVPWPHSFLTNSAMCPHPDCVRRVLCYCYGCGHYFPRNRVMLNKSGFHCRRGMGHRYIRDIGLAEEQRKLREESGKLLQQRLEEEKTVWRNRLHP